MDNFERLLAGAHAMDKHFKETPIEKNVKSTMPLSFKEKKNIPGIALFLSFK